MKKAAIIVPCFNESRRLQPRDFETYTHENEQVCFIFVNDGSTDNTGQIVEELCRLLPGRALCIHLETNRGKATAVRAGVLKAMEMDFEYIGYWDADLSTPLSAIGSLCGVLDDPRVSIVMGSRVKLLGRKIERRMLRHYFGRGFATLASMLLGLPVYDTQCGAKLFKNSPELARAFSRPFLVKWTFDVELLARFKLIRDSYGGSSIEASIVEYPLEEWTHMPGSKIKIRDVFSVALELLILLLVLYIPGVSRLYREQF